MTHKNVILLLICILPFTSSLAQKKIQHGKGIRYEASDSSFSVKVNARFQTLFEGKTKTENTDHRDKFMIRRMRLKMGGYVYSPAFGYKVELALSNRDQRVPLENIENGANIVLDAVMFWRFAKNWELWVGQTKLPGNRERVISSQQMQLVDRSLLNARYTLDRDKGIQLHHQHKAGKGIVRQALAISMGEGRNAITTNSGGYDYTFRTEYLPFGKFKSKGDYVGGDVERETTPKLSIAATYDYNDGASRHRGQLGEYLESNRTLTTVFVDMMLKYNGFSMMGEYAYKNVTDGLPYGIKSGSRSLANPEGTQVYYYTGTGINLQAGYLFANNIEVAARYTGIDPEYYANHQQYTLGLSKYVSKHMLKVQGDISYMEVSQATNELMYRLQLEVGF